MSELPALEAALTDAARRRHPRRRAVHLQRLVPLMIGLAIAVTAASALVAVTRHDDPEREARPPEPTLHGFARHDASAPLPSLPGVHWAVRVDRNPAGERCVAVGQLAGGEVTRVVGGRRERVPRSSFCARPPAGDAAIGFEWRRFQGRQLTILYGIAGREVRELRLTTRAGTRTAVPGPKGSFIAVFEDSPATIDRELLLADGSTRKLPPLHTR